MSIRPRRPLATPAEAAEYMHVSTALLRDWRYRGTGPRWSKVGKFVRYDWADIDTWIAAQSGPEAA